MGAINIVLGDKGEPGLKFSCTDGWASVLTIPATIAQTAARAIIFLPGLNEGTIWEFAELVKRGKIGITTVVMPDLGFELNPKDAFKTARTMEELWNKLRIKYTPLGINLPPYNPDGLLMKFDDNGALRRSMILSRMRPQRKNFADPRIRDLDRIKDFILQHI